MRKVYPEQYKQMDEYEHYYACSCVICGDLFQSKRDDALYCSVRCRVQAHRDEKKGQQEIDTCYKNLKRIIVRMPRKGDSLEFQCLLDMKNMIEKALGTVESDDCQDDISNPNKNVSVLPE